MDTELTLHVSLQIILIYGDVMDTNSHENEKPLFAYSVQGDEYGCVVFARSNVVARRNGANELGIEFGGLHPVAGCQRWTNTLVNTRSR